MSVTTEHLSNYLNELDSYMKRLERDGLSKKDRKLFLDLNNEYYDVFQQAEAFPEEILQGMSEFGDNIISQSDNSKELAGKCRDNIVQYASDYIDTTLRSELQFGIFQKDAEISSLQHEKIQMMQELVDLDMKTHGHITDLTQDILEVQNCNVSKGRVRELSLWEQGNYAPDIMGYQEETEAQNESEKKEKSMEKKRVLSKDELDQILSRHFQERQSGRETKMLDLSNCIISNYVFKGDLSAISFDRSDLRYCEFRMTKAEHVSFQNAVLADCKFTQAEFDQCSFNNADVIGTVIRNSMFREGSFDTAYMRQSAIHDSIFYRTSFVDTRIHTFAGNQNIFHECGHPENTVRPDAGGMTQEEAVKYENDLRKIFSNEGYVYSWELSGVDPKNYAADLSIKIFHDGEILEEEKYSALLDADTYEISHIDTGRQGDSLVRMFLPEMNAEIVENVQNKVREQEQQRVKLKFPYMTRETFMEVKDEIKRMGAAFDPEHKAWYVNRSDGKEEAAAIQDYIAGHDEAIYLQLPSAGPKEFKNMIEQLKHDGARYNSDKKAWFITEKTDRSKFEQFLPAEKDSVHEKLNAYKSEAGKQRSDHHEIGDRRKETPERA